MTFGKQITQEKRSEVKFSTQEKKHWTHEKHIRRTRKSRPTGKDFDPPEKNIRPTKIKVLTNEQKTDPREHEPTKIRNP